MPHGYFTIGIYHTKTETNIGTLWRSAWQCGAAGIFTVDRRYRHQSSDTQKTWQQIPLQHYVTIQDMIEHLPYDCTLVGVETGGKLLRSFVHPERCCYLLGAEDHGLPEEILGRCQRVVSIEAVRNCCFNVAVAGSIVMYDRCAKLQLFS